MKTVFAAALTAAALFAGAAQASEATHNGVQVRSTVAQPADASQGQAGFGGLSVQRDQIVAGTNVNDPARSAASGN